MALIIYIDSDCYWSAIDIHGIFPGVPVLLLLLIDNKCTVPWYPNTTTNRYIDNTEWDSALTFSAFLPSVQVFHRASSGGAPLNPGLPELTGLPEHLQLCAAAWPSTS